MLRLATIHACKLLDALTRQGSAHTPVRDLGLLARSSAFGGERHPHGQQHAGPGSKENEDNLLSTAGAAGLAGAGIGAAAGGRGVCAGEYGGQSAGDGGGGAGEDIQIRSLEALTGIGELGVPRQRAVAMALALADYGPIEGHKGEHGRGAGFAVHGGRGRGEHLNTL